jgi:hypothetical protein
MELWMVLASLIVFCSGSSITFFVREIVKYQRRQIELLTQIEREMEETRKAVKMLSELQKV